jgi:outer membrane protein OmpA-like peptidoglycan-associated protein
MRAPLTIVVVLLLAAACAPRKASGPLPQRSDLIVLLPAESGGHPGRATVAAGSSSVDLDVDRAATSVVTGHPPSPPVPLDEQEVQRLFGDAVAALPAAPQFFQLYFQFESNDLTAESRALVPDVLRIVAARVSPEVVVAGHTDTTGSSDGNFRLGRERADAVLRLLVSAGLDAASIEVLSLGETDLLVPTPDDTQEPRNRRVEIAVR